MADVHILINIYLSLQLDLALLPNQSINQSINRIFLTWLKYQ